MVHIIIIIWFGQSGFLCSALNYIIILFPDMIISLFLLILILSTTVILSKIMKFLKKNIKINLKKKI